MANLPPPNDDLNIPEDEPVNPKPALVVPNPAPMQPNIVLNDVEEENLEEDLQENLEEEEELEDDNDDMNDVEVINPFEEANPLNQSPPDFEAEWRHVPTGRSTTQLLPTIRRYSSAVYFGESSSSAAMRDVEHYRIGMEYYRDTARPYEPTYASASAAPANLNDLYVASRDAAVVPAENDNDATAPRDPQPSESHRSPHDP
ncbi:hypothetical protein Tco_0131457 [Tanacetum coccineum]